MFDVDKSTAYVNKIYDGLSYFDQYGGSLIMFIMISIIVFYIYAYFNILQGKEQIVDDWVNQRCNPKVIPFAGWINAPEGKSAHQYTGENFQYCVQNTLTGIIGTILEPFNYLIKSLTNTFSSLSDTVNSSRGIMAVLRDKIGAILTEILTRLLNVVIPIQRIFIALIDVLNKTQGIMVGSLYTALGSYMALQSLMGAIMELIIKLLVALAAVIVGLWAVPVTWPVAASTSAVFLSISIPLAIIVAFMSEVLHIKTGSVPSLPKMRCFDRSTPIVKSDGVSVPIEKIIVGDVLKNGDMVTATIKVNAKNLDMYVLNGIVVSETHKVKLDNTWVNISKHPKAVRLYKYDEPYLYCLNTTSKTICLNNNVFCDWDEVYGEKMTGILDFLSIEHQTVVTIDTIHKYVDVGFKEDTMMEMEHFSTPIKNIQIGDITLGGGEIYGIVKIMCPNTAQTLYNFLCSDKKIQITHTNTTKEYTFDYDGVLDMVENLCR